MSYLDNNNNNNNNNNNEDNLSLQPQLIDSNQLLNTGQGWDRRLFREQQIAHRFICSLCKHVCRNAQELSCTKAHLFCESCITSYQKNHGVTCPICFEMNVTFQSSRFVNNQIMQLKVFCPRSKHVWTQIQKEKGINNNIQSLFCPFHGILNKLIIHAQKECVFNIISCPFHLVGCPNTKIYRYQLQNHIQSAQNRHISLALKKLQSLQKSLQLSTDNNKKLNGKLRAVTALSKTKDQKIENLQNKINQMENEYRSMKQTYTLQKTQLQQANQKINKYEKAVEILKKNNSKLAKSLDLANEKSSSSLNTTINTTSADNGINIMKSFKDISSSNNIMGDELMNQFQSLMSFSESQTNNNNDNNNNNNNNKKQPNSTDVVSLFLKLHPDMVTKLKNNNQMMYANIITDDEYASQFIKKMLGNNQYKKEISSIVQKLQNAL